MSKPRFLVYDTLDDRREIYQLLDRLPPRRRLAFLHRCCQQATFPNCTKRPGVSQKMETRTLRAEHEGGAADRQLTLEIYFDIWALCTQYELDLDAVADELVLWVRGKDDPCRRKALPPSLARR